MLSARAYGTWRAPNFMTAGFAVLPLNRDRPVADPAAAHPFITSFHAQKDLHAHSLGSRMAARTKLFYEHVYGQAEAAAGEKMLAQILVRRRRASS